MTQRRWTIYLSGEIHSDWRQRIENGNKRQGIAGRYFNADHGTRRFRRLRYSYIWPRVRQILA